MIEQLIQELIAALNANTAAVKAASNVTVTSSGNVTLTAAVDASALKPEVTAPAPTPEPEKKPARKPKTEAPKTETPPPAPALTLEDVRGLGQKILDLTGSTDVIRGYVATVGVKSLRELKEDQWAAAHQFLTAELAKIETKAAA